MPGIGIGLSPAIQTVTVLNQIQPELPADYWQENDTENYFIEETTGLVLTLEDL